LAYKLTFPCSFETGQLCLGTVVPDSEMKGIKNGLWYLTPLSTIFKLYRMPPSSWKKKPEFPEKTMDKKGKWKLPKRVKRQLPYYSLN
jgi:hypothetical protein